jgi:hypothetical protein
VTSIFYCSPCHPARLLVCSSDLSHNSSQWSPAGWTSCWTLALDPRVCTSQRQKEGILPRMCKGSNFGVAYSRNATGIDEERTQDDVICRGSLARTTMYCTPWRLRSKEQKWCSYAPSLVAAVMCTEAPSAELVLGVHIPRRRYTRQM